MPGFFSRSDTWWDIETLADFTWARRGMDRRFYAVHESDGPADAYAMYRVRHDWTNGVPGSELNVNEIMAVDGDVAARDVALHPGRRPDQAHHNRSGSADEPLTLMVAEPRRVTCDCAMECGCAFLMSSCPRAARYAADGTVVFDVSDEFVPRRAADSV